MSCQLPSQAKHRTPSPHLAVPSVSLRGALRRGALRLGEASDTLPSASHTPCRQLLMRKPLPWGLSGGGGHSAETGSPGSGARSRAVDPQWPHMLTVSTCSQGRRSVTVSLTALGERQGRVGIRMWDPAKNSHAGAEGSSPCSAPDFGNFLLLARSLQRYGDAVCRPPVGPSQGGACFVSQSLYFRRCPVWVLH